jgi:hypothetical protein
MNRVLMVLCCLLLASCFSGHRKEEQGRNPASDQYANKYEGELGEFLKNDPFTRDGYDHNQDGSYTNRKFQPGTKLSPEQEIRELAGREIWFKSAPNERFHTYYFPQKLNSPIAWYKILRADRHDKRFADYGLMNDPDCCVPGVNCDDKAENDKEFLYHGKVPTMNDTYGWEYCRGDQALLDDLKAVGKGAKSTWKDPACDHPVIEAADKLDKKPRENACELAFGNASGAIGYRKFPNPRFNALRWAKIGSWEGYEKRMTETEIDASIEPPFRIGKACSSCHASFDALNPPEDINNPTWKNIKGETGNQYINISSVLGSGAKHDSIEYQMFVHSRAGAVDTSAVPMDFVSNPGTINALINIPQRPLFEEVVDRWVQLPEKEGGPETCAQGPNCQVIHYPPSPEHQGGGKRYWQFQKGKKMQVLHILKGAEDSVGADLAAQRVYVNIGMCAEQCWVNHFSNLRELDPAQRGYQQTPFNIKQCRQDCASWRANEDRIGDVFDYILSRRPTDLKDAHPKVRTEPAQARQAKLAEVLDARYGGEGLVENGKKVFAQNCATCHSSQNANKDDMDTNNGNFDTKNFFATRTLPSGEVIRADWMGNDKSTPVELVGTYKCRSLHSNHMTGHVWEEFGSVTNKERKGEVTSIRGEKAGGGRGFYRNISLLNLWAHAPFLHNNSVGPELCGYDSDPEWNVWRTSIEGEQMKATRNRCDASPNGMRFDNRNIATVETRMELFDKSVDQILKPANKRIGKKAVTDEPIRMPLGMSLSIGKTSEPMFVEFPAGVPVTMLGSFDIKGFASDMTQAVAAYQLYLKEYKALIGASKEKDETKRNQAAFAPAYAKYQAHWTKKYPGAIGTKLAETSLATFETFRGMMNMDFKKKTKAYMDEMAKGENQRLKVYIQYYANCDGSQEDGGHEFGTQLSDNDKKALKAFLATL